MTWDLFWDFIFPPYCVSCEHDGEWWCGKCRAQVQLIKEKICPACLKPGEHECTGFSPFNQIVALGYYHDPILRKVITNLKFNGTSIAMRDIGKFIKLNSDSLLAMDLSQDTVLVPIPLSEKRHRSRGFNQAMLLAHEFKNNVFPEAIIQEPLIKIKNPDPQSSLGDDMETRTQNIQGCFKVAESVPKNIILVDDVITTGATAAEAAKVLLANGAEKVSVLALALGA